MIKCVIIEDEPKAVELLKIIMATHFSNIEVVAAFDKVSTAAEFIQKNNIDFVFLDVQLNGEVGIDILDYFPNGELNFEIIFTTAYGSFAVEAFALCAIDFVLKPINVDRLLEAVNRVLKKTQTSSEQLKTLQAISTTNAIDKIILSMSQKKISIKTDDIVLLKADNVYTEFYLRNNTKEVVSKPLKEYELLLSQPNFYKPHRSYIINLNAVNEYLKPSSEIVMINNLKIPIAREKKKEFEELLFNL
jgi:two-component system, LytTR family, response regulator